MDTTLARVGLAVVLFALVNVGCAVKKIAVNKLGNAIASGGTTYASDDDPELVREAVPFSLKLMESLLEESPRHRGLLLRDLAEATRLRGRARRLDLRARDYGLRGLEVRHPGFSKALRENPGEAVRRINSAKEVPWLYWTAASWGEAISLSKDNPDLIAEQPMVEALIDRAYKLDPDFEAGAIDSLLITYEPSRQGAKGDPLARSREHFARAVALSHGQLAGPYVSLAETVSVQKQDRAEFQSLLNRALAVNPNDKPEWRLENLVMQRRARWLLARADELFVE